MEIVAGIIIVVALGLGIWFLVFLLRLIFGGAARSVQSPNGREPTATTGMTGAEEGNVHSGPHGYSPNTAYPETQYGSGFDPDADWNHEEQ
jgi:hypothetical protein